MLPHVEHEQRNGSRCDVALLIVELLNDEVLAECIPSKECPAGTLESQCNSVELRLECVEGSEEFVDSCSEFAGGTLFGARSQVLPEDGVVGVTTEVECQVLLELVDVGKVVLLACFSELLECSVCAVNVCLVVLAVVLVLLVLLVQR